MSPRHTNKGGARYRYSVSQAVLQKKPRAAGSISRVPAAEIEALVMAALRHHLDTAGAGQEAVPDNDQAPSRPHDDDRELVERHVERVTLTPQQIKLRLHQIIARPADADNVPNDNASGSLDASGSVGPAADTI